MNSHSLGTDVPGDLRGASGDIQSKESDPTVMEVDRDNILPDQNTAPIAHTNVLREKPIPEKPINEMTKEEKKAWITTKNQWFTEMRQFYRQQKKAKQPVSSSPKGMSQFSANHSVNNKASLHAQLLQLNTRMQALSSKNVNNDLSKNNNKIEVGEGTLHGAGNSAGANSSGGAGTSGGATASGVAPKKNRRNRKKGGAKAQKPIFSPNEKRQRGADSSNTSTENPQKKKKENPSYRDVSIATLKLYIRKVNNEVLTNDEMSQLALQLQETVVGICLEEDAKDLPIITGNFPSKHGFCVICGDSVTYEWIKKSFTGIFSLDQCALEIVGQNEIINEIFATVFVPRPSVELATFLIMIGKLNPGIQPDDWTVTKRFRHDDGSSLLYILINKDEKKKIEDLNCRLLCGITNAQVRFPERNNIHNDDPKPNVQ